jgi:folate-binding protein YgfZ
MLPTLAAQPHDSLLHACVHGRRQDLAVLKASGPKLRDYLQGQITQNMAQLDAAHAIYAMALTPQGKAVADLFLAEESEDTLILLTWRSHAEPLVARLRQFAIGYALRIGIVADMAVHSVQGAASPSLLQAAALPDPGPVPLATAFADGVLVLSMPEAAERGYWLVAQDARLDALSLDAGLQVDEAVIRCARTRQGHPVFGVDWDASIHPLNANLAEYHGVSFDKGCYVGQEVTSRMHWRGGIKYRLYRLALSSAPAVLPAAIHTTVAVGTISSAMQDSDGGIYGIGRLPISIADGDASLRLEDGSPVRILGPCHG